jgi:exodeoxyribonuclease V alpha subunit
MLRAESAEERCSLRGIVDSVFYSGPAFTAGRLRTGDGALVNFAGKVFAKPRVFRAVRTLEGKRVQ